MNQSGRVQKLIEEGKLGQALQLCEELISTGTETEKHTALRIWLLASPDPAVSNPSRAQVIAEDALRQFPDSKPVLRASAYLMETGLGDYAKAAEALRRLCRSGETAPEDALSLARLIDAPGAGVGDGEALEHLERALGEHASATELWRELGLVQWRRGELEGARQRLSQYVQLEPDSHQRRLAEEWIRRIAAGTPYRFGVSVMRT